jgi:hypothetical protein
MKLLSRNLANRNQLTVGETVDVYVNSLGPIRHFNGFAYLLINLVLLLCFLTIFGVSTTSAQTPTPTPSEEEQRLQEEKRLLDLQKAIEEDKKAIREAQPKASVTPLSGDTTLTEGVRLETEIVSYKAMAEAAKIISAEIHTKIGVATALAIYDGQTIKDWRFYQALSPSFKAYVQDLKDRYVTALCAEPALDDTIKGIYCTPAGTPNPATRSAIPAAVVPEAFAAGSTFLKSFIDLAALFRTDTKIEGKSVTIEQNALVAEILRRLRNDYGAGIELYNPAMFPPRKNAAQSETIKTIGELFLFKKEADRLIKLKNSGKPAAQLKLDQDTAQLKAYQDELEQVEALLERLKNFEAALHNTHNPVIKKRLSAEIAKVSVQLGGFKDKDQLKGLIAGLKPTIEADKATIKAIETSVKALTDMNDRFQSFVDEFLKVGPNGMNALALFIKSEDLDQIMNKATSYWLEIRSATAGGNNRTRKNLIWFFAGARVDHSGGVVLEYTLYDRTGAVVYSDKLSHYEGYVQPKKIMQKPPKGTKFEDPQ